MDDDDDIMLNHDALHNITTHPALNGDDSPLVFCFLFFYSCCGKESSSADLKTPTSGLDDTPDWKLC